MKLLNMKRVSNERKKVIKIWSAWLKGKSDLNDGQYLVTLTLSFRFAFATIKYHLGMSVYDIFAVECFLAWNFNVNCYLLIETSKNENLKLPTVTDKITTCEKIKRPLSRSTSSIFSPCFIIYYWEPWGGPCVAKV